MHVLSSRLKESYVGKRNEALARINELKQLSKKRYVSPFGLALIYAGLGDRD
jgi:hypothetical protein